MTAGALAIARDRDEDETREGFEESQFGAGVTPANLNDRVNGDEVSYLVRVANNLAALELLEARIDSGGYDCHADVQQGLVDTTGLTARAPELVVVVTTNREGFDAFFVWLLELIQRLSVQQDGYTMQHEEIKA